MASMSSLLGPEDWTGKVVEIGRGDESCDFTVDILRTKIGIKQTEKTHGTQDRSRHERERVTMNKEEENNDTPTLIIEV
jgi:hypothetical protein